MYCYWNNGMSYRLVDTNYVPQAGEVLFSAEATSNQLTAAFSGYAAAAAAAAKDLANASIMQQLTVLDTYIPRSIEDMWSATGFDITKLPAIQQTRLAQKQTLRSQIQK